MSRARPCYVCNPPYGVPSRRTPGVPVTLIETEAGPPTPMPPRPLERVQRCDHDMLPGQCSYCKAPPGGLPPQVWITEGGQTFHAIPSCPALTDGQNYARRLGMQVHPIVRRSVYDVISARGQCTACFSPEDLAQYAVWQRRRR